MEIICNGYAMFWCRKFITDTSTHIVWSREFGNVAQAYGYETSERTCLSVALKIFVGFALVSLGSVQHCVTQLRYHDRDKKPLKYYDFA